MNVVFFCHCVPWQLMYVFTPDSKLVIPLVHSISHKCISFVNTKYSFSKMLVQAAIAIICLFSYVMCENVYLIVKILVKIPRNYQFYEECFSYNFTACLASPRALEPVDQVQLYLIERNKLRIPISDLIIIRYIKERDPRSAGNEGGLGTASTVCIPGEMAFSSPSKTVCALL